MGNNFGGPVNVPHVGGSGLVHFVDRKYGDEPYELRGLKAFEDEITTYCGVSATWTPNIPPRGARTIASCKHCERRANEP